MSQDFQPGDFLIFQLESGYGLLRVLAIEETEDDKIWHLAAYDEMFLDPEMADASLDHPAQLHKSIPHVAITTRAFESTQVARMKNVPLTISDLEPMDENIEVSDRSIRLLLGLR